jgi:hypothetical protein
LNIVESDTFKLTSNFHSLHSSNDKIVPRKAKKTEVFAGLPPKYSFGMNKSKKKLLRVKIPTGPRTRNYYKNQSRLANTQSQYLNNEKFGRDSSEGVVDANNHIFVGNDRQTNDGRSVLRSSIPSSSVNLSRDLSAQLILRQMEEELYHKLGLGKNFAPKPEIKRSQSRESSSNLRSHRARNNALAPKPSMLQTPPRPASAKGGYKLTKIIDDKVVQTVLLEFPSGSQIKNQASII